MQNKQNVFSFYLDESIWFKEGQGVRELIGISLEPEISIEELGDVVRLKGTVELAGEYIPTGNTGDPEDAAFTNSVRIMDHVAPVEGDAYEFRHQFPVEITVPLERVSNLEDVLIDIESFDYELPATRQLRLHAHININGIEEKDKGAANAESFDESARVGPVNFPEDKAQDIPIFPEREAPVFQFDQQQESVDDKPSSSSDGRWTYKKSQSFPEFFGHTAPASETPPAGDEAEPSMETIVDWEEVEVSVEESQTSSSEEQEQKAPGGMDGIKQIFKHLFPNREDTYTQMKMYIAQEEETLSSIAEKYGVTVKQLERVNEHTEDVSPGQIVYIPS
ncbi:stage VI sporulation protein D [Halobacillus sp. ACCC02827]|uniref:stage VI sporulation protein D n=1 Tax=unclassified Halobacillus TaxID=2636472 RepID=UPI0007807012|nr:MULTISPECIES: stage VI sporulation protein D [unclassified Halobacillus]WJE14545.1 stage VI sporulation protein D [Halobacillus sp. ACCC02827]